MQHNVTPRFISKFGARRMLHALVAAGLAFTLGQNSAALAQGGPVAAPTQAGPEFREPVVLASKDGVLEVRLTARQGEALLDTVAQPVRNFLLFDYELIHGTASDGQQSGRNQYPAPTLNVYPGQKLIVHMDNALSGLNIRDFYSPQYTATGQEVPLYPIMLETSPLNLHVHGLHVSPKGNSDNVLIHIPHGMSNTYVYDVPTSMPHGIYWYHPHLHGLTAAHVYLGLAGMLAIGRTDGNLPVVTARQIPIRNMALQYNFVANRENGGAELTNPYWPQYVSTIVPPVGDALVNGTYEPSLAPVNLKKTPPGTKFATVWYSGPLSIHNMRGMFQFMPSNLQSFTPPVDTAGTALPANPALPDSKRDVQFTVNGQFQPVLRSKPGQTEIWVLANISDIAYLNLKLTETATGRHQPFTIVGQDGNPYPAVHAPITENGTRLLIPPASRYAIAVTMPESGELVLEMAPRGPGSRTISAPGVLYTKGEGDKVTAALGNLSLFPETVSYFDGFFVFPTQVLARASVSGEKGETTVLTEGQALGAFTSFEDVSDVTPDLTREIKITGGFLNDMASTSDPKSFVYAFDGGAFPNVPLIQPRLDSIEEWRFVNYNNDEHPIHIHVNDFQVTEYYDPTAGVRTGPQKWGVDNANAPAPTLGAEESVVEPGILAVRTKFEDYTGVFVMHCHRLNHEDNGLMMLVSVIPAVSSYAIVIPGENGGPTQVRIFDAKGNRPLGAVTPFPGYAGPVSVTMGDVDDDGVLDLIVGAGKDHAPEVVAYAGRAKDGQAPFSRELTRFSAFGSDARGGVSVGAAQIDGGTADNIVVGSGAGSASEVRVFGALPASGAPKMFASFNPYPGDRSGVSLTTGFVDFATGRFSIVTAPGAGTTSEVKVFAFPLLKPVAGTASAGHSSHAGMAHAPAASDASATPQPVNTASFKPFGDDYRGGVSLATGWFAGQFGGAERIAVGRLEGSGTVKMFSNGSALDGGPSIYLHSPVDHGHAAPFREVASFVPFPGATAARVAATATTFGAELLVGGVGADGKPKIARYDFIRPGATATSLEAKLLADDLPAAGSAANVLGGD